MAISLKIGDTIKRNDNDTGPRPGECNYYPKFSDPHCLHENNNDNAEFISLGLP